MLRVSRLMSMFLITTPGGLETLAIPLVSTDRDLNMASILGNSTSSLGLEVRKAGNHCYLGTVADSILCYTSLLRVQ